MKDSLKYSICHRYRLARTLHNNSTLSSNANYIKLLKIGGFRKHKYADPGKRGTIHDPTRKFFIDGADDGPANVSFRSFIMGGRKFERM